MFSSQVHPTPLQGRFSNLRNHRKHTGIPAGSANFAEMQIKTGRFMFFITRLTENTNLAAAIPPSEQVFNAARINIALARPRFAELDIASKPRPAVQQAFAHSADSGWEGRERESAAAGFEG